MMRTSDPNWGDYPIFPWTPDDTEALHDIISEVSSFADPRPMIHATYILSSYAGSELDFTDSNTNHLLSLVRSSVEPLPSFQTNQGFIILPSTAGSPLDPSLLVLQQLLDQFSEDVINAAASLHQTRPGLSTLHYITSDFDPVEIFAELLVFLVGSLEDFLRDDPYEGDQRLLDILRPKIHIPSQDPLAPSVYLLLFDFCSWMEETAEIIYLRGQPTSLQPYPAQALAPPSTVQSPALTPPANRFQSLDLDDDDDISTAPDEDSAPNTASPSQSLASEPSVSPAPSPLPSTCEFPLILPPDLPAPHATDPSLPVPLSAHCSHLHSLLTERSFSPTPPDRPSRRHLISLTHRCKFSPLFTVSTTCIFSSHHCPLYDSSSIPQLIRLPPPSIPPRFAKFPRAGIG